MVRFHRARPDETPIGLTPLVRPEMAAFLKTAFRQRPNISMEESELLSRAYQQLIGSLRASWRVSKHIEERKTEAEVKRKAAAAQRQRIVSEIMSLVEEVVALAATLAPHCTEEKMELKLMKLTADYLRYAAEAAEDALRQTYLDRTLRAYNALMARCCTLRPLDPVQLGATLNTAVFHYELQSDAPLACHLVHSAFKAAVRAGPHQDDDRDAILIMTLLRDNHILWVSEWGWAGEDVAGPHKLP